MEFVLPTSFIIGIILIFFFIARRGRNMQHVQDKRFKTAKSAKAKILGYSLSTTRGRGVHGYYQVYQFTLEVYDSNKTPYKAKALWEVYQMATPVVQEGSEVNIKIDAQDPDLIYPCIQSVEFSWSEYLSEQKNDKR